MVKLDGHQIRNEVSAYTHSGCELDPIRFPGRNAGSELLTCHLVLLTSPTYSTSPRVTTHNVLLICNLTPQVNTEDQSVDEIFDLIDPHQTSKIPFMIAPNSPYIAIYHLVISLSFRLYLCPLFVVLCRGGRSGPFVACWISDHWVAGSNPLRSMFN